MLKPQVLPETGILKALEHLEDATIATYQSRSKSYLAIQQDLENQADIGNGLVQRLLAVCVQDLEEDMKYAVHTLNIINVILKKSLWSLMKVDLQPSLLAIVKLLKSAALINKAVNLQKLCFEVLQSFPDETFRVLGNNQDKLSHVLEVFDLYLNPNVSDQIKLMPFNILFKLLTTLPPEKKSAFVKDGTNLWFSKVIPFIMTMVSTNDPLVPKMMDILDMLTEELKDIDYSNNSHWLYILDGISEPENYLDTMKSLLKKGDQNWCRLWIVFVKLAKQQITMIKNKSGSPINSMLPVVEAAFKMDTQNRCMAFQCWKILIDNFASESSDSVKRIKLLMIPLKSNNAKVEETALAKFDTWWHLIKKFYGRSEIMFEVIVIPFLQFCFGNSKFSRERNTSVPGLCFSKVTVKCAQAFTEICGHLNCQGCVTETLPLLDQGMLTSTLLKPHFSEWIFSLKSFISAVGAETLSYDRKKVHIQCVWSSFVLVMAELTNNSRITLLGELLNLLHQLVEESDDAGVLDIVFNVCLRTLLVHQHVKNDLHTKNGADASDTSSQLHKVIRLTLHPRVQSLYKTSNKETIDKLELITNIITDGTLCTPNPIIEWLLTEMTANDSTLLLWTALLKSAVNSNLNLSPKNIKDIMMWPLRHLESFNDTQYSATIWNNNLSSLKAKLDESNIQKDIKEILTAINKSTTDHFYIYAVIHIISYALNTKNSADCKTETELLVNILSSIKSLKSLECHITSIIDCLESLLVNSAASTAEDTISASNAVLNLFLEDGKDQGAKANQQHFIERIIKAQKVFFKTDSNLKYKNTTTNILLEIAEEIHLNKHVKDTICSILKVFLKKSKPTDMPFYSIVNNAIISIENKENLSNTKENKSVSTFTTPGNSAKKSKKKEANIVNTVMDNGEEYVVVKSHWKFNPRKLTENQKEKLKRKREDIPALYQDLSQSQDEFKLSTWKADSQDTSTSNSKSESTNNTTTANIATELKEMPSVEMVPEIMKNILSSSPKIAKVVIQEMDSPRLVTAKTASPKPKNSPRMSLKERVLKNVCMLSEKTPKMEINQSLSVVLKTPDSKMENLTNAAFSEPSKLIGNRPARAKRKPKKYDLEFDTELIKKRNTAKSTVDLENAEETPQKLDENISPIVCIEKCGSPPSLSNLKLDKKIDDAPKNCDSEIIVIEDEINTKTEIPIEVKTTVPTEESKNNDLNNIEEPSTPVNKKPEKELKSSTRKPGRSRIIKELLIDTVEGNPFLNKSSEKRPKRKVNTMSAQKTSMEIESASKKSKSESKVHKKALSDILKGKSLEKEFDNCSESLLDDDIPLSEDFIESSQDSTLTTISIKSTKSVTKKPSSSNKTDNVTLRKKDVNHSQSLLDDLNKDIDKTDDIEFSRNKSVNMTVELKETPDLDTEPIDKSNIICSDVIIIDDPEPIIISTNEVSPESQEIASADTQPVDAFTVNNLSNIDQDHNEVETQADITDIETALDSTAPNNSGLSSPFEDQEKRNKDFLNDTLEISPIKTMSPVKDNINSPTSEVSNDYLVIKLQSPVQSNGEPFEKSASPEIFTEDKVSPDKRDISPPREVPSTSSTASPTSLSLKKNRPQVRAGNRAAQMIGLCAPERIQNILNNCDREEEPKRPNPTAHLAPARRNLRIQYLANENNEGVDDNEGNENFLMFKKVLPSSDSSPVGPILKRKLADMVDETTLSPASKRKRVSFHDPPVSTTVSVQKYIEPLGLRSPQGVSKKITRQQNMKSPKKLESMFKLDTVLTNAVECFNDITPASCDDTQISSLEPTLSLEVIRNEELNDTDPICRELIGCEDSITNIASELSSPAMKTLFVKELKGKVETIGDLAKMSELEVNRLCIKAPKVATVKRVLNEYASKRQIESQDSSAIQQVVSAEIHCSVMDKSDIEMQTDVLEFSNAEIQTNEVKLLTSETQTNEVCLVNSLVQTDESGTKSTKDIITSCLAERQDFIDELKLCLNDKNKRNITNDLQLSDITDAMQSKIKTDSDAKMVIQSVIKGMDTSIALSNMTSILNSSFTSKGIIMLCSDLLRNVHDNTA